MFKNGDIDGVVVRDLKMYQDKRGWLTEIYREDELAKQYYPVMAYISMTYPDTTRGPHEHVEQTDNFVFLGPSTFKVYVWDGRKSSPTYGNKQVVLAGEDTPKSILIPPGVVHAYKNIGGKAGVVLNCPNRLFAGEGKKEPVDEIRHEDDPDTIYKLE